MSYTLPNLHGSRVLVLEDEYYLADDLVDALQQAGAKVVGPVSSLRAGHEIASADVDIAVLDMNIHGEFSHSIADRLLADQVPVIIATGYSKEAIPERLRGLPQIEKPFDVRAVVTLIAREVEGQKA